MISTNIDPPTPQIVMGPHYTVTLSFDLTWDVHVLVFDTDCVDTHLLGNKLNAVVVVIQTDDVTQLGDTRGTGHGGGHVERTGSYINRTGSSLATQGTRLV